MDKEREKDLSDIVLIENPLNKTPCFEVKAFVGDMKQVFSYSLKALIFPPSGKSYPIVSKEDEKIS